MKTVKISADLERRLRASSDPLVAEVVELLDAKPVRQTSPAGLSYKELVTLFRAELGDALALPPNPNVTWIIRQVTRAKELGLDGDSIARICQNARRLYPRPPYDFEWLLRAAARLLAQADDVRTGARGDSGKVHTGRRNQDGGEDGDGNE